MAESKKKLAIVLPGGGVRGVLQARLLKALDEKLNGIAQEKGYQYNGLGYHVDYIAGTSIGATNAINTIIKGVDNLKFTTDDNFKMFTDNAGTMLKKNSFFPVTAPYFSSDRMEEVVKERFGEKTFSNENLSGKILINSFNLESCCNTIFTNIGTEEDRRKLPGYVWDIDNIKLRDAAVASASIPGALPAKEIEYAKDESGVTQYHEVDGCMINNSPVLSLVTDIHTLDKVDFRDMFVVSIGTGSTQSCLSHMSNKGVGSYMLDIIPVLSSHIDAIQKDSEKKAEAILNANGGKFYNLNPILSDEGYTGAVNDTKESSNKCIAIAEEYIAENDGYLNELAHEILQCCF